MTIGERPGGRGFSMLEITLAFTILALAIVPILSVVFGTNRLQNKVTGVFREAVAGRMVWEAMKGRNQVNEMFLRDLAVTGFDSGEIDDPRRPGHRIPVLTHVGAFVASGGPLEGTGRPVPLSPLVSHLINRTGGTIVDPGNRDPLEPGGSPGPLGKSELASLHHNFEDLAFRVTVMDGLLPAWTSGAPTGGVALAPSDLVKDVTVEVYRVGPDRKLPATPAFRLDGALQTPSGSLPPSQLKDLVAKRDTYSYEDDFRAAYAKMAPRAFEEGQNENVARALSNLLLIVVESVGESMLTQADDFGFGIEKKNGGKGTDYWIDKALGMGTNLCRTYAADLLVEKARGICAAYRRSERPMIELAAYAGDFGQRLLKASDEFSRARVLASTKPGAAWNTAAGLKSTFTSTITETKFWLKFFSQESFARAMLWPGNYARRLEPESLVRAQELYARVEADNRSTPMDRMRALNAYVQVLRARKLYLNRLRMPSDERLIADRAAEYRTTMRPYAEALLADEVFDLQALINRNVEFNKLLSGLKRMGDPDHPYQVILKNLHPSGLIGQTERTLTEAIDFFGANAPPSDLTDDLGNAVNSSVNTRSSGMPPSGPPSIPSADLPPLSSGNP